MKTIKYLDTFAGVGGFHLALEQSIGKENIECIGYSEIDKFCKQVYQKNFPGCKDLGDITKINIDKLEDFDLLTGGFPCQDVSVAGKQNLESGRTVLVEYLLQILEKKQPKYFIFENVKGFMGKKFKDFIESIFERIGKAGYNFGYKVLNTKDFGLPQNRERVFIVGHREENPIFNFPQGKELTTFLKDILEEEVDEKYYMTEKQYNSLSYDSIKRIYTTLAPILNTSQGGHRQPKILFNKFNNRIIENVSGILGTGAGFTNKQGYMVCNTIKIKNSTKKGYLEAQEGDGIILDNPNSQTKRGRVKKGISGTLTCAGSDGVITRGLSIRKLTPTEYSRLQGFPDNWSTNYVSNSQAYKQMGNAISVPVVKSLFDNLLIGN